MLFSTVYLAISFFLQHFSLFAFFKSEEKLTYYTEGKFFLFLFAPFLWIFFLFLLFFFANIYWWNYFYLFIDFFHSLVSVSTANRHFFFFSHFSSTNKFYFLQFFSIFLFIFFFFSKWMYLFFTYVNVLVGYEPQK